jgi:hypothetical protein
MNVTIPLLSFVVLLGVALAWRFYRWRWRPRLIVDAAPRRGSSESGPAEPTSDAAPDWLLRVRNRGPATAKRCRATLLRLHVYEDGRWHRLESDPQACPMSWSDESRERSLAPGEAADLVVVRGNGLPAGRYRFKVAVINGEERRVAFELAVPERDRLERNPSSP